MSKSTALAERSTTVTPAEALKLVRDHVRAKYVEAKKAPAQQFKQIAKEVGGQVDKLDRAVVEDVKRLAIRLAAIARRSGGAGYNTNKAAPAIQAASKKLFVISAELESVVANDVEIPLFEAPDEASFFGYGYEDIRRVKIGRGYGNVDLAEFEGDADLLRDHLSDLVGHHDGLRDEVHELLAGVTITMPAAEPEADEATDKPAKRGRKAATTPGPIYIEEEDEDEDGEA